MSKKKPSKSLVIDASVARSSGGSDAVAPTSKQCRAVLETIMDEEYTIIMTTEMKIEWDNHKSNFAHIWYSTMVGRKRVKRVRDVINDDLRSKIYSHANQAEIPKMYKDCHLVEASVLHDKVIISSDNKVRRAFSIMCVHIDLLKDIFWANPNQETIVQWLIDSAEKHPDFILCEFAG